METATIGSPLARSDFWPREKWRKKANRFYFFAKVIVREAFDEKLHDLGVIHRLLCEFLDPELNPNQRKIITLSRGTFKTSIILAFVVFLFVWSVVKKKPVSIVYNTATKENAESFMSDFRQVLRDCELLYWIFPEFPHPDRNEKAYRRETIKRVEIGSTKFHVASLDTKQVSRHYSVLINDDIVNDDNAHSDTEREKVKRKWKYQKSIVTKYKKRKVGMELEIGTPYDSRDLMAELIKGHKTYDRFIMPYAISTNGSRVNPFEKNGILTFPELMTWEDYQEIYEDQGESIFASQYELILIDEGDRICREEWIQRWDYLPDAAWRCILVDPAGTEEGKNDPTGIIVFDVGADGRIYIIYADELWLTPGTLIETIERLRRYYDPDEVIFEKEKYSITIADIVPHIAPHLMITLVEHKNQPKEKRIHRLKQWFETQRILFAPKGMEKVIRQALNYPDIPHEDILDALANAPKVMVVPNAKYVREDRASLEQSTEEHDFDIEYRDYINSILKEENHDSYY